MSWATQRYWRWCRNCQGLWYGNNFLSRIPPWILNTGKCAAGGGHDLTGSANYSLVVNSSTPPGQNGWRWCGNCQGLWYGSNSSQGSCPAGGSHSPAGSGDYTLAASGVGQTNWRWCGKCQGLWYAGNATQGRCPAGGGHQSTGSMDYRALMVSSRVRLHTKVLVAPNVSIDTMMQSAREVYANASIDIEWASHENLHLPALEDLDVGGCTMGQTPTQEQDALFWQRQNAGIQDIVVYFVRSTIPVYNGCASYPPATSVGSIPFPARPGAVVAQGATQWTLAHEVGHVLGLPHVSDNDRLMTGNGTSAITNPPPDLISAEVSTMITSEFSFEDI